MSDIPVPPPDDLGETTRAELYEMARDAGIEGRSGLTKAELHDALREAAGRSAPTASRVEQFRLLAGAVGRGELVMLPRALTGDDRRRHVRQTIREDHETRIARGSVGAQEKFEELADSRFAFFRGTALLFYRDMAGEDAWMPTVLTLGDVHPANFGVMPNADDVPIFGVNDFDEACYAPFTWDLRRGVVGFLLAAEEEGGKGPGKQRKIAARFLRGYVEAMAAYAREGGERDHEVRADNAPPLIRDLIEGAQTPRAEWLADDYLDEHGGGFRADEELVPETSRREEFQAAIDDLAARMGDAVPARAGEMRVKDVAVRRGQGTASLGLDRHYVLIEGPRADGSDDLVIELKAARRSALSGLAPSAGHDFDDPGERIVHAQGVQLVRGDVFYGTVELDGQPHMSRERAPYRDDVDLDDLSTGEWKAYADTCGRALAHAHALSDEVGRVERDVEPEVVAGIGPPDLFVDDLLRFGREAVDRLARDHECFRADHALGAFGEVDRVYR